MIPEIPGILIILLLLSSFITLVIAPLKYQHHAQETSKQKINSNLHKFNKWLVIFDSNYR